MHTFFCGPESFTPDLLPIDRRGPRGAQLLRRGGAELDRDPHRRRRGAAAIAHWIVTGSPDIDVTAVNIDRLHPYQATPRYRATRTVESLGLVYQCHYPGRSMRTARGVKRSPLHDRLAEHGAWFKDVSRLGGRGLVRRRRARCPPSRPPRGAGPTSRTHWAAEHGAVREGVGLFDMSFMAKFAVTGPRRGGAAGPPEHQPRRRRAGADHLHPVA